MMVSYLAALIGAALVQRAYSHNTQGILLVNGTETKEWKYVRDVGTAFDDPTWPVDNEFPKVPPQIDVKHPDITCGRSAFKFAATTETADVLAGSEVGFRVSWDGSGKYGTFWHPGPAQIYLSRAPNDDVEHYEGDGDWFKIAYAGPINNARWQLQSEGDFNFTIPQTTPPGKYLLRIEQFMPTEEFNYSQWYVNCAHVNIIGPGGGKPTEFAKFPGTYRIDDPGIWIPKDQVVNGWLTDENMRLTEYVAPGPTVWTG